jgi:hypothetical protein
MNVLFRYVPHQATSIKMMPAAYQRIEYTVGCCWVNSNWPYSPHSTPSSANQKLRAAHTDAAICPMRERAPLPDAGTAMSAGCGS